MLKSKLLELNLVVDNEYLDKYCELIESHINDKKISCVTQAHHIVPQYYYKDNNLKVNSKKENKVNLTHKEHALAHYYLSLCSIDKYIYKNECSLEYILGHNFKQMSKEEIIRELDKYQKVFEDFCRRDKEFCKTRKMSLYKTPGKPVAQYDKDTLELIEEFESVAEASRKTGINSSLISACKNGKAYTAGGYAWAEKDKIPKKREKTYKHINQYNKDTLALMKEWNSALEIEKQLNIKRNGVRDCCNGKISAYKDFVWRYVGSDLPLIIIKEKKKRIKNKVRVYNLNGELINIFDNVSDVCEKMDGLLISGVQSCCYGKNYTYKGYIFLYENKYTIRDRINNINKHKEKQKSRKKYNSKKVCQYTFNCDLISTFSSISEASEKTLTCKTSISNCCNKKTKKVKEYIWCFKGDKPTPYIPKIKTKEKEKQIILIAYNKYTKEKVGEWSRFVDAIKETGKSYSRIKNCCCDLCNSVDDYIFNYSDYYKKCRLK